VILARLLRLSQLFVTIKNKCQLYQKLNQILKESGRLLPDMELTVKKLYGLSRYYYIVMRWCRKNVGIAYGFPAKNPKTAHFLLIFVDIGVFPCAWCKSHMFFRRYFLRFLLFFGGELCG